MKTKFLAYSFLILATGAWGAPTASAQARSNPLRAPAAAASTPTSPARVQNREPTREPIRETNHESAGESTEDLAAPPAEQPGAVRQASHAMNVFRSRYRGGSPVVSGFASNSIVGSGTAPPPDIIYEGEMLLPGDDCGVKGGKGCDVGVADCCGGKGCRQCCLIPCPTLSLDNFEFFGGVHGMTGPANRGQTASFGFHEGVNWGAGLPCTAGAIGVQLGANVTHSNFSGAEFTNDSRHQVFVTGGLFRRVDWGLQGGVVFDYLSDDWYTNTDTTQIRSEVSWVFPNSNELGFWFNLAASEDQATSQFDNGAAAAVETWEPTETYAFFYRLKPFDCPGATSRLFAGFTGASDGLIGADLRLPLGDYCALQSGFSYLVPEQSAGQNGFGHRQEAWNVGISLVWFPGCRNACDNDYFRPLFDVADNGTFFVERR